MSDDTTSKENTQDVTEEEEEEEEEEEFDPTTTMAIRIDDEIIEIDPQISPNTHFLYEANGRREYAVFRDSKEAGEAAREHWKDMADNDPSELRAIVGDEVLVQWALGCSAGPGSHYVSSLTEWLDLWLDIPEEHFANYDGHENDCMVSLALATELGWETADAIDEVEMNSLPLFAPSKTPNVGWLPAVAYRSN